MRARIKRHFLCLVCLYRPTVSTCNTTCSHRCHISQLIYIASVHLSCWKRVSCTGKLQSCFSAVHWPRILVHHRAQWLASGFQNLVWSSGFIRRSFDYPSNRSTCFVLRVHVRSVWRQWWRRRQRLDDIERNRRQWSAVSRQLTRWQLRGTGYNSYRPDVVSVVCSL